MNFQPDLARAVMAGEKTVTRRLVSENPRSPWWRERCALEVNRTYAVCPGRGKPAIGRVRVLRVWRERLGIPGLGEARREGFQTMHGFRAAWASINGSYDPNALVWRIEFVAVPAEDLPLWESAGRRPGAASR